MARHDGADLLRLHLLPRADLPRRLSLRAPAVGAARPALAHRRLRHARAASRAAGHGSRSTGAGDCVDCGACVLTCPTGIDIRDGLQMECIHCTQCIDACDAVMAKVGRPPGLIRYSSRDSMEGRASSCSAARAPLPRCARGRARPARLAARHARRHRRHRAARHGRAVHVRVRRQRGQPGAVQDRQPLGRRAPLRDRARRRRGREADRADQPVPGPRAPHRRDQRVRRGAGGRAARGPARRHASGSRTRPARARSPATTPGAWSVPRRRARSREARPALARGDDRRARADGDREPRRAPHGARSRRGDRRARLLPARPWPGTRRPRAATPPTRSAGRRSRPSARSRARARRRARTCG